MPTVACPKGHASVDSAICSVCGVLIAPTLSVSDTAPTLGRLDPSTVLPVPGPGLPLQPLAMGLGLGDEPSRPSTPSAPSSPTGPGGVRSAPADPPPRDEPGWVCANCTAEQDAGTRFCEVCGYDPSTGSLPHANAPVVRPASDPSSRSPSSQSVPSISSRSGPSGPSSPWPSSLPATGTLVAVITADHDYFLSHQIDEVQFPVGVPTRTIELAQAPASIGRRSRSRGTNPAVDLAGPPEDPAVSALHASLLPTDDGRWTLVDHGSTNGTYLNESPDAVPANHPLPVGPGDRIYVGAWTCITLELG